MTTNNCNSVIDVTIGNPHVLDVESAYLAGLIDGEGTITLERAGKRRLCDVMGLTPKVIVTNTNEAIIDRTIELFKKCGVNPYIKTQAVGYGSKPRRKICYWVCVSGLTRCAKILKVVLPYLVGKLAQAHLVLEFVEVRGDPQMAKGKPYGVRELSILDRIRALNHRGTTTTEDHGIRHLIVESKLQSDLV